MRTKILMLSILLIGVSLCIKAQGNLQFNQVRFIEMQFTYPGQDTITLNIPANKVLKIEGHSIAGNACIYINDKPLSLPNTNGLNQPVFPIWLPSGNYSLKLIACNSGFSAGNVVKGAISAIEFNVVP